MQYLVFCWAILQGVRISWHKLTSSSGCSSCWSLHAARWAAGSLFLRCILQLAGHCEGLSTARRCTRLETSSEEEGTSFKSRVKAELFRVLNKLFLKTRNQSDDDLTWCSLHFCPSSCQTRQGSRLWRTGGRTHLPRATASFRHSEPSRRPIKAPQTPSERCGHAVRALLWRCSKQNVIHVPSGNITDHTSTVATKEHTEQWSWNDY